MKKKGKYNHPKESQTTYISINFFQFFLARDFSFLDSAKLMP